MGSALFQVVRHIKFNTESENENEPAGDRDAVGLSPEYGGANQNLFETKAQTQTKSKQSLSSSLDFKIFKIILKG